MMRARQLGMLTYRGRDELDTRFGKLVPELDRPPVAAYLDHHGQRFAERFPVRTFLLLSEAIDRCTSAADADAVRAELARVTADVLVVGVPGDLLFPYALQHELYRELQAVGADCVAVEARLRVRPRRVPRRSGPARGAAARRAASSRGAAPRAAVRGRRRAAGARDPDRHDRLRHVGGGVLELLDRQDAAMRRALRRAVPRHADRGPRPRRSRAAARRRHPAHRRARSSSSRIPRSTSIVEVAGGAGGRADASPPRSPPASRWSPRTRRCSRSKLAELGVLAQRTETPLLCEAAAAAAMPIIRHLSHRADEIDSLMAIVNGTCNYIITRLEQDELPLDRAIAEAQALGLRRGRSVGATSTATTPPRSCRSSRTARSARGCRPTAAGARHRRAVARRLRSRRVDGLPHPADRARGAHRRRRSTAAVEPLLLPDWHLLASVEEEYNAVYLQAARRRATCRCSARAPARCRPRPRCSAT